MSELWQVTATGSRDKCALLASVAVGLGDMSHRIDLVAVAVDPPEEEQKEDRKLSKNRQFSAAWHRGEDWAVQIHELAERNQFDIYLYGKDRGLPSELPPNWRGLKCVEKIVNTYWHRSTTGVEAIFLAINANKLSQREVQAKTWVFIERSIFGSKSPQWEGWDK